MLDARNFYTRMRCLALEQIRCRQKRQLKPRSRITNATHHKQQFYCTRLSLRRTVLILLHDAEKRTLSYWHLMDSSGRVDVRSWNHPAVRIPDTKVAIMRHADKPGRILEPHDVRDHIRMALQAQHNSPSHHVNNVYAIIKVIAATRHELAAW